MQSEVIRFPPMPIALKMAVAVGIGMLIGLEREWSNKDVGIRTFASWPWQVCWPPPLGNLWWWHLWLEFYCWSLR